MYTPEIQPIEVFSKDSVKFGSLRDRVNSSVASLEATNATVLVTEADQAEARVAFLQEHAAGKAAAPDLSKAGVAVHLHSLLSAYDQQIVTEATTLRTYITNKLLELSDNEDPKVQLVALEKLGRVDGIDLFKEKSEVTYANKSETEIRNKLRAKLSKIIDMGTVVDANPK